MQGDDHDDDVPRKARIRPRETPTAVQPISPRVRMKGPSSPLRWRGTLSHSFSPGQRASIPSIKGWRRTSSTMERSVSGSGSISSTSAAR